MKITVIGTGYVGLVTGTCFASFGNDVTCVDIDEGKIERLKNGIIPIYEPGLTSLVKRCINDKCLSFTTNTHEAVQNSEVIFIAVGTPSAKDGSADLSYVMEAARQIGKAITPPCAPVIVAKSTVPIGTNAKIRMEIERVTTHRFAVVSNPEFLKEGDALNDFMKPDRIVIGVSDDWALEIMRKLYSPFTQTYEDRLIVMDPRSAEMTKYACNAYLATRISFMNEMANLCERVGADVDLIRRGMGSDPRIGPKFLFPGIGFGGSCFPKDVDAMRFIAKEHGDQLEILEAVERVNRWQKMVLPEKIEKYFCGDLEGRIIAVWGLAFKPGTDDVREAPALTLIADLCSSGARVHAHDPVANNNALEALCDRRADNGLRMFDDHYSAAEGADALVICTEWSQFRQPNLVRLKALMKYPVVFDGRNVWNPVEARRHGYTYHGIGRL